MHAPGAKPGPRTARQAAYATQTIPDTGMRASAEAPSRATAHATEFELRLRLSHAYLVSGRTCIRRAAETLQWTAETVGSFGRGSAV